MSPFFMLHAMGVVPTPATSEIVTAERTAQDLSLRAKSEALGKICCYVKEPCGLSEMGVTRGLGKHT